MKIIIYIIHIIIVIENPIIIIIFYYKGVWNDIIVAEVRVSLVK